MLIMNMASGSGESNIPEDLRDLVCTGKSCQAVFALTAKDREVLCLHPIMAKLKRLPETGDAFVLGQRLAILQMRMSLGVGAISLKDDYLKIFIKDAWEMIHSLQQQAEELEKEFDVKMEYLRAFFAGMRWAGTK